MAIGINDQTATPVGTTSWQPSHRLRVWTGPFTAATGELEGVAEAAPTSFERGCARVCQIAISGLTFVENIPNAPDMFYSALEAAARVKHGLSAEDRAEAAITATDYTVSFVLTIEGVAGPLSLLGAPAGAAMNSTMENGATVRYSGTATAIGMPVQLVTCHGACGLAQELQGILGAPVRALPTRVDLNPTTGLLRVQQ